MVFKFVKKTRHTVLRKFKVKDAFCRLRTTHRKHLLGVLQLTSKCLQSINNQDVGHQNSVGLCEIVLLQLQTTVQ